jgi:hypothetical protein
LTVSEPLRLEGSPAPALREREERLPPSHRHGFELAAPGPIAKGVPADCSALIEATCKRPEIRPLSSEVSFAVDARMTMPFRVRSGYEVVLNPRSLANPALCALHLRHALELALLHRELNLAARSPWHRAVAGILACRTAAIYFESLIFLEQELARPHLPNWLCRAFAQCAAAEPALPQRLEELGDIAQLLALQGETALGEPAAARGHGHRSEAARWLLDMTALAAPTEVVIASGGDSRSRLNPRTGLNNYGCCPRPRPWAVTFASSTATSISDLAYQRAEMQRAALLAASARRPIEDIYPQTLEAVRARLAQVLGLPASGTDVVLTSSGTDAELYALYLAQRPAGGRVVNLVVAPDETGSGVLNAAAGRHFSDVTPSGTQVHAGTLVDGFDAGCIEVQSVPVRDETGALLPAHAVDAHVEQLACAAVHSGARVLLHLVDAAKTGMGAPSLRLVTALCRRFGEALDVVVDACQLRLDPSHVRAYLQQGWMLLLTGSKFFTGPPFSGALIVPPRIAVRAGALPPLPAGLADYCSACDWPAHWSAQRAALPAWRNFGLLFRWEAALWEMEAFFSVEPQQREQTLHRFIARLREAIARCEVTELADTPHFDRTLLGAGQGASSLQTILTFAVLKPEADGGLRHMTVDQTQAVYQWLNVDISHQLPLTATEADAVVARRRFHIGQPVKLARCGSTHVGGLRIAAGARLVSGVAHDSALGPTREVRLEREIADAEMILDKIRLIVRHFDSLSRAILPPACDVARLYEV